MVALTAISMALSQNQIVLNRWYTMDTEIKEYIDTTLSDWLYQPHILEMIENKTFLEDGPIVLKRIDNEDYMQIPLFRQVAYLCETVRAAEKLKLTTAEILPRALLHGIYRFVIPVHYFEENIARLRTENGWYTVSLTRLLAEIGGPIKKRSNALTLTKEGERALKDRHLLLKSISVAFGHKLSWAYFDLYENRSLGQWGFGLSLLLMADYGNEPRDSRLHMFRKKGVEYTFKYQSDNSWDEEDYVDYSGMKISDLITDCGDSVIYLYDYGYNWEHTIELLEVVTDITARAEASKVAAVGNGGTYAGNGCFFLKCHAGERRCPAEDCGGIHGYHEMLKILRKPAHSDYKSTLTWLGNDFDPNYFNLQEVNNLFAGYCT